MNRLPIDLTVVIPYYDRENTIGHTLRSVAKARQDLQVEVLLIDDGSTRPAKESLSTLDCPRPDRIIRQTNQGLLFARLRGLTEAQGEYVLFLDSDDLVSPQKFVTQLAVMRTQKVDVSYTDTGIVSLLPNGNHQEISRSIVETTTDAVSFFLRVQPAPHSPIFLRSFLRNVVTHAAVPPAADYNPVAEIWFYHNAALHEARVAKVSGVHTLIGEHDGARITQNWEKMGFASVALATRLTAHCRQSQSHAAVLQLLGATAFEAWRRLPFDFSPSFQQRLLWIWRQAPSPRAAASGGPVFRSLARLIGTRPAGSLMRRLRGKPYAAVRTVDWSQLRKWEQALPPLP